MTIRSKLNNLFLGKHSWIVNMVTGGILFSAGDLIEQTIEIRKKWAEKYDWKRTG